MTVSLGVPRVHAPVDPSDRPAVPGLVDRYGRAATDLRVSLTDRCNLRCGYCMPPEGFDWLPTEQILTDDEVIRLVTIAVERLGVHEIRFTGGEPLLRKGLERIVAATSRLRLADGSAPETSLTSNALGLDRRARGLAEAGLSRVNVSLDSLDRATYATMARRDRLPDVLSIEEVGEMLDAFVGTRPSDLRDRALLEVLYGCGLRASEAVLADDRRPSTR